MEIISVGVGVGDSTQGRCAGERGATMVKGGVKEQSLRRVTGVGEARRWESGESEEEEGVVLREYCQRAVGGVAGALCRAMPGECSLQPAWGAGRSCPDFAECDCCPGRCVGTRMLEEGSPIWGQGPGLQSCPRRKRVSPCTSGGLGFPIAGK